MNLHVRGNFLAVTYLWASVLDAFHEVTRVNLAAGGVGGLAFDNIEWHFFSCCWRVNFAADRGVGCVERVDACDAPLVVDYGRMCFSNFL
jgi:hypothetical protein